MNFEEFRKIMFYLLVLFYCKYEGCPTLVTSKINNGIHRHY